jgi:hypothetical protein
MTPRTHKLPVETVLSQDEIDESLIKTLNTAADCIAMKGIGLRPNVFLMENGEGGFIRLNIHASLVLELTITKQTRSISIQDLSEGDPTAVNMDNTVSLHKRYTQYWKFTPHAFDILRDPLSRLLIAYEDKTKNQIPPVIWDIIGS